MTRNVNCQHFTLDWTACVLVLIICRCVSWASEEVQFSGSVLTSGLGPPCFSSDSWKLGAGSQHQSGSFCLVPLFLFLFLSTYSASPPGERSADTGQNFPRTLTSDRNDLMNLIGFLLSDDFCASVVVYQRCWFIELFVLLISLYFLLFECIQSVETCRRPIKSQIRLILLLILIRQWSAAACPAAVPLTATRCCCDETLLKWTGNISFIIFITT